MTKKKLDHSTERMIELERLHIEKETRIVSLEAI
jgi:hypothetical protein